MSKNISPTAFSSKIDENGGKGSRDKSAAIKEAELRGVIRVLINKNQRLQRPVMAARRLAKYYQIQKDEVERMKEVAHNYKTGMERAERRSAQLQYDLARSYNTAAQSKAGNEAASKDIKDKPKGLPFHLPTSARQIIDGLTTDNVRLMKSLQRMSESGEVDLIIKVLIKIYITSIGSVLQFADLSRLIFARNVNPFFMNVADTFEPAHTLKGVSPFLLFVSWQ